MAQPQQRFGKSTGSSASSRTGVDAPFTLSRWWRRGITLLLLVHLIIVIAVPLAVSPGSRLADAIVGWTRPWIDIAQPSYGYGYFAPEPGPSHLMEYELEFAPQQDTPAGTLEKSQFPLRKQWPRLRYHRYFMLSEKAMALFGRSYPPRELEPPDASELESKWIAENWRVSQQDWERANEDWKRRRTLYKKLLESFGQHLIAERGATVVRIRIVRHTTSRPEAVAAGAQIDDTRSYEEVPQSMVTVFAKPSADSSVSPALDGSIPEYIPPPVSRDPPIRIPGDRR